MIVTTTDTIAGKRIVRTLGLVRGNTIRARHLGRDIVAGLRNVVGGEISEYTKLMAEAREQAVDRMVEEAQKVGANAVVEVRFSSSLQKSNPPIQVSYPISACSWALNPILGLGTAPVSGRSNTFQRLFRRIDWTATSWVVSACSSPSEMPSAMVKSVSSGIAGTRSPVPPARMSMRERMCARRTGAMWVGCWKPGSRIRMPLFFWRRMICV